MIIQHETTIAQMGSDQPAEFRVNRHHVGYGEVVAYGDMDLLTIRVYHPAEMVIQFDAGKVWQFLKGAGMDRD